jgi:hypothetical protein
MTADLEDQLAEGMREYANGLSPAGDVVGAAARRHRRRTSVRRSAYAGGVATLAAALAIGFAATGPTSPRPGDDPGRNAPAMLTVAEVSTHTTAALANSEKSVEHVVMRLSVHGQTARDEIWYDAVTGASRRVGPGAPGLPDREVWTTRDGERVTYSTVDRAHRVWSSYTRTVPGAKDFEGLSPSTPERIRAALKAGADGLVLVGPERLGDRATLHLTVPVKDNLGSDDLWVDADTYQVVRRVLVKRDPGGDLKIQEDFEWLKRTPETLVQVVFAPPAGFTQVPAEFAPVPSPRPGGNG